jgi:hypothetical protein
MRRRSRPLLPRRLGRVEAIGHPIVGPMRQPREGSIWCEYEQKADAAPKLFGYPCRPCGWRRSGTRDGFVPFAKSQRRRAPSRPYQLRLESGVKRGLRLAGWVEARCVFAIVSEEFVLGDEPVPVLRWPVAAVGTPSSISLWPAAAREGG